MEKRVFLAIFLSFVVLLGYQALFPPPEPSRTPPATPAATADKSTGAVPPPAVPAPPPAAAPVEAAATVTGDAAERDISFENTAVRAVFSNRGATLKSWRLKHYFDESGQPLELVPVNAPEGSVKPFALAVDDGGITARLQQALFKPSTDNLNTSGAAGTLIFEYQDASGLTARKEFSFTPEQPYVIGFSANVTSGGKPLVPVVRWGPALGDGFATNSTGIYNPPPQPIFHRDGDATRVSTDDIQEYASQQGVFGYAGVDDHYFIAATLPGGQPVQLSYAGIQVPPPTPDGQTARFVDWSVKYGAPPANARFFFGPKDFDVLRAVDKDFVRAIHFGMFRPLVVPLLNALKWVHGYVGNYGWAIVILTALINIAMFPLRHKSVVSMRKMQEIQPEIKAIQERYAKLKMTDPGRQKMNVEMMNLYRERGVNPASGCVPMLLTIPVLFAFYAMLSVAIELRGAPFFGWIQDLSKHDPFYVMPLLMAGTQFVQTKMTPSTADPMQQKMMLFMPLIFIVFFITSPSGLMLYWTVSNLWAIGQQALTNRMIGPMPQRTVRPPAERKLKNAGAGRSDKAAREKK